jgi:hypothetical protein
MKPLLQGSLAFLENAYDEREGLFSYSTRLREGRLVQDFAHPGTRRYTINSLLGLRQATRLEPSQPWRGELPGAIERFLDGQYPRLDSAADLGLLLALLDDRPDDPRVREALKRVRAAADADGDGLHMQDIAWMLWGACAVGAQPIADRLYRTIVTRFVEPRTGLPRHTLSALRGHVVSFGTIVYFLRALHEYATAFGSDDARARFDAGVERILDIQGPQGEWPWLISVRTGVPLDFYPVFTVHQDSMAMLFLLPALDAGLERAHGAIQRSFAWNLGENQLGIPLVVEEPFLVYRSIERTDRLPRARRYGRSLVRAGLGRPAGLRSDGVRINDEARSYHLGWVLYVWSGRDDVPGLAGPRATARAAA